LDPYLTFKLILLLCFVVISGFFSSSEASLFSLTRLHLHKMKVEKAGQLPVIERLLRHPRRLIIAISVGNESVNIMISALTASIFILLFGDEGKWTAIAVLTPVLLVFCEAIPKTIAKIHPIAVSRWVTPLLTIFSKMAFPVVWALDKSSGWLTGPFRPSKPSGKESLMERELKVLVDAGHEEGVLEKTHRDLIHRVFELGEVSVEDIMTPRIDMFCLSMALDLREMKQQILKNGYSRVPVYGADQDDILGILYAKDLLQGLAQGDRDLKARTLLRNPYFVPQEKRSDSLLRDFQARKIHMAVVVDEYGGIAGLVTMDDILESLFGDIYDERDVKEKLYRVVDEKTIVASGRMPIEEFNELSGMDIPSDDFDTLGGFVFHLVGRLPAKGEEVHFAGRTFSVERMQDTRIQRVRVVRETEEEAP
jgi:CBS domain containing-hemolysin-like protein